LVWLGLGDKVPDTKTIWLFREHLSQACAVENLFARLKGPMALFIRTIGISRATT